MGDDGVSLCSQILTAGGTVTTWSNRDPVFAGNIVASGNKLNHKKIIKLLRPVAK